MMNQGMGSEWLTTPETVTTDKAEAPDLFKLTHMEKQRFLLDLSKKDIQDLTIEGTRKGFKGFKPYAENILEEAAKRSRKKK